MDFVPHNLISPPAAQTDNSIAVLWQKPYNISNVVGYRIYVNGEVAGTSQSTDYTITDLTSSQEYEIFVRAVLKSGELSAKSNKIRIKTKAKPEIFDITSFGAVADGRTMNTEAIQKAIDTCSYGGKVYVPKGVFLTGAIYLKSNMTLYIEEGGVLLGSPDTADYPLMKYRFEGLETTCYASLINTRNSNGERFENIIIEGPGKIDANGCALRKKEVSENGGKPGRAICIRNTDNLYLKDITVKQSPAWCVHFIYCNHVSINNIKVYTRQDEDGKRYMNICNGDGIDPDSSSDVYIFNSVIASQDDCIAIKSGRDAEGRMVGIPSENIRITNCTFKSGFGVAVGSEASGSVRNVFVQDCSFDNVYSVATIKASRGRGGVIKNVRYEDIIYQNHSLEFSDCRWFRGAINIDQFYSHEIFDVDKAEEMNDGTPVIQDIYFKNILLDTYAGNAIYLAGLPESHLKNIYFENVKATGKYGFKAYNVDGLYLTDVSVVSRQDEPFVFKNVKTNKSFISGRK